jgi:hypothetical protein
MDLDAEPAEAIDCDYSVDESEYAIGDLLLGRYGYMIVDCGATSNMCGLAAAEDLKEVARMTGFGSCAFDRQANKRVWFGNGSTGATIGIAYIPAQLAGERMVLPLSILDAEVPPILSVSVLNSSGAVMDFGSEPGIWFSGLQGPKAPCVRLASGLLAIKAMPGAPEPPYW